MNHTGTAQCAFMGHFKGYNDKMVAVTSKYCPISKLTNFEMSFFIPELCPNHMFFVAKANGIGIAYKTRKVS